MQNYRLLIVEDDPTIAARVSIALSGIGTTELCKTASDAIERLSHEPLIDLVFLDLILPNGKGIALVEKFQEEFNDIPIVVLSAHDFDQEKIILAGAHDLLRKPDDLNPTCLKNVVIQAIARHKVRGLFEPIRSEAKQFRSELEARQKILEACRG